MTLNSFQKRLVHQLIEVEYPSLVSIGKPTFVQIIAYNKDRENAIKEERVRRIQQRIQKQTGFRWVAEALAGGDLSDLEPGCFMGIMLNAGSVESKYPLNEFAERLKQKLKDHRPVLVGHNLFIDLVYFCRCFLGPLPDSVGDFKTMIHDLFPMLMDTKYLATHDCGSITPKSSLPEINDKLSSVKIPQISKQAIGPSLRILKDRLTFGSEIHPHHSKYNNRKIEHEAGYDSLLTAQIFVKLSAQLRDGGISKHTVEKGEYTVSSGGPDLTVPHTKRRSGAVPPEPKPAGQRTQKQYAKVRGLRTRFDLLEVQEPDEVTEHSPEEAKVSLQDDGSEEIALKVKRGELIPRLDAEFWKVYGNRLRVFGTVERVCIISREPPRVARQLATVSLVAV